MDTVLQLPDNVEYRETMRNYVWFDGEGIMYVLTKYKAPPITVEQTREILTTYKEIANGKKFCILADVTHATPSSREAREFTATELPKIVEALAMVSASPIGRMVANLFFALKPTPYPAKMFSNEKEAKEWLRKYI